MTFRAKPVVKRPHRSWESRDRRNFLLNLGFGLVVVAAVLILAIAAAWTWYDQHLAPVASVNGGSITKDDFVARDRVEEYRLNFASRRIRDELNAGRLTQAQMNKLMARIDARGDCRLSVAEMAATVGLSESWFANMFKQTTGKPPLQWQLGKRIEQARAMLLETDLTIADIAAQLGFSDQAHLTKAFRQLAGETPAAWRRMRQVR